jgi:NADPH:quinone reductase-like Zn-dependent oxidoreductase
MMAVGHTMAAVTFAAFGPPEVLQITELPVPEPGRGEVVVRVVASTVNPTDLLMRSGAQAAMMAGLSPPFIAGMEFSGHIQKAGPEVDLPVGAAVIGVVNPRTPSGGAHAQFVRAPATSVAPLERQVDLVAAATVPMNALTALMALEWLGLPAGSSLLVTGGAGMLGGSAIQLARLAGLRVFANCGPADRETLLAFGADVLPREEGLAEHLRAVCPAGVDGLIDGALIGAGLSHLVRGGGAAVSLRRSHPIEDSRLRCHYVSVTEGMHRNDLLRAIAGHLEAGLLRPRLAEGGLFGFRDAIAAHHAAAARGLRGRVVMRFSD